MLTGGLPPNLAGDIPLAASITRMGWLFYAPSCSDFSEQEQEDQNGQNKAESAGRTIAPITAGAARWGGRRAP